jgi:membrane-anchored glycerophosphoryl diester phosphodiesterase (GDPDase)
MAALDLRPLSLGEILDRTFTLYRSHFVLFFGIAAIPQLLVLALQLIQFFLRGAPVAPGTNGPPGVALGAATAASVLVGIVALIALSIAYLLSQGATVSAVADLYVGRTPTIGDSFRKVRSELGNLYGVTLLNGLVVILGFVLLVIPGVYLMCRLMVALPSAVLENLGPRDSLSRSMELTKNTAGRAFLIFLLYFVLLMAFAFLFQVPLSFGLAATRRDPDMVRLLTGLMIVVNAVSTTLVMPVFTIATSAFYFDLRVRKEAFDIQMLMNPGGTIAPATSAGTLLR